jgi:hypothetical protein
MNIRMAKPGLNLLPISRSFDPIEPVLEHWLSSLAHSYLQSLQFSLAHHLQIRHGKQHQQLAGVLCPSPIAHFAMSKFSLVHTKRVLNLDTDAGLEFLQLFFEYIDPFSFVHSLAVALYYGNVPVHIWTLREDYVGLSNAPITRLSKDNLFLPMKQGVCMSNVMGIGCCGRDRVHQTRLGINANMCLHAKIPLVGLLGLLHLGVAFTRAVFGLAGRTYQGGVHNSDGFEHQATVNQLGIDGDQYLLTQSVLFEQMAKAQDDALIGQASDARIQVRKSAVQRDVVKGLFHGRTRVPEELLHQVNSQQHFCGKRRLSCLAHWRMRRDQRQQLCPRNHQIHLVQKRTFAGAFGDQLESRVGKAHLFHGSTVSNQTVTGLTFAGHP